MYTSFSKAGAKVLLFFDMTKYFSKKNVLLCVFLFFVGIFVTLRGQKTVFFAYLLKK